MTTEQGGELPSEYTRLNYLESSRGQFIDTGIAPVSYGGVGIKIKEFTPVGFNSNSYGRDIFYGCSNNPTGGSTAQASSLHLRSVNGDITFACNGTELYYYKVVPVGVKCKLEYGISSQTHNAYLKIDDNIVVSDNNNLSGYIGSTYNLTLCKVNQPFLYGSELPFWASMRFGEVIITSAPIISETLTGADVLRHFIPALDNSNRPCLYDLTTEQPYYNGGTGEFLYG